MDSSTPSNSSPPAFNAAAYVEATAAALQLTIPAELQAGVVTNFEHLWAIAQPVVEFPLPDTLTSAPTFTP